jgi:hypothetical protein
VNLIIYLHVCNPIYSYGSGLRCRFLFLFLRQYAVVVVVLAAVIISAAVIVARADERTRVNANNRRCRPRRSRRRRLVIPRRRSHVQHFLVGQLLACPPNGTIGYGTIRHGAGTVRHGAGTVGHGIRCGTVAVGAVRTIPVWLPVRREGTKLGRVRSRLLGHVRTKGLIRRNVQRVGSSAKRDAAQNL